MWVEIYKAGRWSRLLYPVTSAPSVRVETEPRESFEFLSSVSDLTIYVEGDYAVYGKDGAKEIATGDQIKIWGDDYPGRTLLLHSGTVDSDIAFDQVEGMAKFSVLGWLSQLKDVIVGAYQPGSVDRSRYWRDSDDKEGMSEAIKLAYVTASVGQETINEWTNKNILTQQVNQVFSSLRIKQEIVAQVPAYDQWLAAQKYSLTVGLRNDSRFRSRLNTADKLFTYEQNDPIWQPFYRDGSAVEGLFWRDKDQFYLRRMAIADVAVEVIGQANRQTAGVWEGYSLVTDIDPIAVERQVRIIDVATGGVDYLQRLEDRLLMTIITEPQTDDTKPELKIYEIVNSYDPSEYSKETLRFTLTWNDLRNTVNLLEPEKYSPDWRVQPSELKTFGRARVGINRVLYYRQYSKSVAMIRNDSRFYLNRSYGEYIIYDLLANALIEQNTYFAESEDPQAYVWNGMEWVLNAGSEPVRFPDPASQIGAIDDEVNFASELSVGQIQYTVIDSVPYAIGLFGITSIQFDFRNKSAKDALVELAKLTNSILYERNKVVYLVKRSHTTGTTVALKNVISKQYRLVDRTGESLPEISSDIVDNEFYNEELAKFYRNEFYPVKEESYVIECVATDANMAVTLADQVSFDSDSVKRPYLVRNLVTGVDVVQIECWREYL